MGVDPAWESDIIPMLCGHAAPRAEHGTRAAPPPHHGDVVTFAQFAAVLNNESAPSSRSARRPAQVCTSFLVEQLHLTHADATQRFSKVERGRKLLADVAMRFHQRSKDSKLHEVYTHFHHPSAGGTSSALKLSELRAGLAGLGLVFADSDFAAMTAVVSACPGVGLWCTRSVDVCVGVAA